MNESLGFKMLVLLMVQVVFSVVILFSYDYTFLQLVKNHSMHFDQFVDLLNKCFATNQKVFVVLLIGVISFQSWIVIAHKQQFSKILYLFFAIIIIVDARNLYTVVTKTEYFQAGHILSSNNAKFDNLKIRTYLYHYFKKKGDAEGMELVVNHSLSRLNEEDIIYLLVHRKDPKFANIVGVDESK
jgi:hypothetical protein